MLEGFGKMLTYASPALNWLGYGARPYRFAEAAPGTYYVPSRHPYQATLPGGIQVQEAYPGQYYELRPPGMHGFGAFQKLPYARWLCALVGAVAGASAGYGGAYYYGKRKKFGFDKIKKIGVASSIATAAAGAVAGYYMCALNAETVPTPAPEPQPFRVFQPTQSPDIR